MATTPNATDQRTVSLVVHGLIVLDSIGLLGIIGLLAANRSEAQVAVLVALIGPGIGALAAMLANTRSVDVAGLQALADAQNGTPPAGNGGDPVGLGRALAGGHQPSDRPPVPAIE